MATTESPTQLAEFIAELERLSVNFPGLTGEYIIRDKLHPNLAHHWRWAEVEPALKRMADFQQTLPRGREGAERRILRLKNPGIPEETVTDTMSVSLQYLLPGEVARTHRHTAVAFRWFLEGSAYTTVNGEKCVMSPGDLVINPYMDWHDHGNESQVPAVWMDGLDYPLVRYLESTVYEFPDPVQQPTENSGLSDRRWGRVGLRPGGAIVREPESLQRSSLIQYRWPATESLLHELAAAGEADPFDDVIVEYVNPATGRSVFTTIACHIQLIRPGVSTRRHRHNGSAVYQVFRGSGHSEVGADRFEWKQGDLFVVPPFAWHSHANPGGEEAILFSIQDHPTLRALGLYRVEEE